MVNDTYPVPFQSSACKVALDNLTASIVHSITRDVKAAQELLGHSRLSTTADVYTRVNRVVGEQATEALAKAILADPEVDLATQTTQ